MKYILAVLVLMPTVAHGAEYKFTYAYNGGVLKYKTDAKTWEVAFARGAQFCFDFYKEKNKKPLSEEQGLDIIDVCANPGESK